MLKFVYNHFEDIEALPESGNTPAMQSIIMEGFRRLIEILQPFKDASDNLE